MRHSINGFTSAFLILLCACGKEPVTPDAMGTCAPFRVPAGTDLAQPVVSFRTDVVPIFRAACSKCHGKAPGAGGVFLGSSEDSADDAETVHSRIVGMASSLQPSMPLITASDPDQSFLMHKLDADQCALS